MTCQKDRFDEQLLDENINFALNMKIGAPGAPEVDTAVEAKSNQESGGSDSKPADLPNLSFSNINQSNLYRDDIRTEAR